MAEMELDAFIASALIQIANGIREANTKIMDTERKTPDPNIGRRPFPVFNLRRNIGDDAKIPGVKFDIAVTASAQQKDKIGLFVAIANIGGGGSLEHAKGDERVHRIQFEVGIVGEWE